MGPFHPPKFFLSAPIRGRFFATQKKENTQKEKKYIKKLYLLHKFWYYMGVVRNGTKQNIHKRGKIK